MGQDAGAVSSSEVGRDNATPDDPQQLREDIERTRQDVGETVAALAEKSDVKARAKDKVAEVRGKVDEKRAALTNRSPSNDGGPSAVDQVREKAQENPVTTAALAAFVGGLVFGRLTKRR